jgi:hypothetical protein
MTSWTFTAAFRSGSTETKTFSGDLAWTDARDALVAELDPCIPGQEVIIHMFNDAVADWPVFLAIDGMTLSLQPADARYRTYSVDNGTAAVIDNQFGLEVAICNNFMVEDAVTDDNLEFDNGKQRAEVIAAALNAVAANLPGHDEVLADQRAELLAA